MRLFFKSFLLIVVFGFLLISYLYHVYETRTAMIQQTGDEYVRLYGRHLDLHNYNYTIQRPPCANKVFLGIFVCSALDHFEQRQAIRETWASPFINTTTTFVYFVLGSKTNDTELQEKLLKEAEEHADIIQEDFEDTYLNLTLKSVMILKWVSHFCPDIRFVMKIDDDMFLHGSRLISTLGSLKNPDSVMLGLKIVGAVPIRDSKSKWFAPPISFNEKVYPQYVSGTGYIMSGKVAVRLFNVSRNVPLFHLEDIYVTGLLAAEAKIKPRNNNLFKAYAKKLHPCHYKDYITYHQVEPTKLHEMWIDLHNTSISCPKPATTVKPTG